VLGDVTSDIGRLRAEKDLELALKNRDFGFDVERENKDIERFNKDKSTDVAFQNEELGIRGQELQTELARLGLGAAGDEAANLTNYQTDIYDSDIELEGTLADERARFLDSIQEAANNRDLPPEERARLMEIFKTALSTRSEDLLGFPI